MPVSREKSRLEEHFPRQSLACNQRGLQNQGLTPPEQIASPLVRAAYEAAIGKIRLWNENPRPFVWHKSADEILESLAIYLSVLQRLRTLAGGRRPPSLLPAQPSPL
jgi:hypothetical protein